MSVAELEVPEPLAHQLPLMDSDKRFKLGRAGRRGGKTRVMFTGAVIGHGPGWDVGTPMFKGLAQGYDVFWILPEIPQSRTIWSEEIRPRFDVVRGARLREAPQFSARLPGMGTPYVISAVPKAIKSVRGAGKRLGGVIIDEAAHMDLAHAWRAVLRPALVDNNGWAIIGSTTNSGHDGNHGDDGNGDRLLPSAFNRWCEEARAGTRGADWGEFYFTGYDNPEIERSEMDALAADYPEGSVRQREEVFAELLTAGAGLAFPEYEASLVESPRPSLPEWDRLEAIGGLDWGYASPGAAYVLDVARSGKRVTLAGEVYFNGPWRPDWKEKRTPFEVGQIIAQRWKQWVEDGVIRAMPMIVMTDSACFNEIDGNETIGYRLQAGFVDVLGDDAPVLVKTQKSKDSRVARKLLVNEVLRVVRDSEKRVMELPALHVQPENIHWKRTVPRLPVDPAKPEDVDTAAEDHAHDAWTYGLQAAWPDGTRPNQQQLKDAEERAKLDRLSRKEAETQDAPVRVVRKGRVVGVG